MCPYAHGEVSQVAFLEGSVRRADRYLAITGPYWARRAASGPFARWAPKMVHLDLAVDRRDFPRVKGAFAPSPVPQSFGAAGLPLALRPQSYAANAEDIDRLKPFLLAQSARYGELKLPITILHGDADSVVGLEIHSRARPRAAPKAKLVVVPGAGHLLHHIVPDRVMGEIDAMAAATR